MISEESGRRCLIYGEIKIEHWLFTVQICQRHWTASWLPTCYQGASMLDQRVQALFPHCSAFSHGHQLVLVNVRSVSHACRIDANRLRINSTASADMNNRSLDASAGYLYTASAAGQASRCLYLVTHMSRRCCLIDTDRYTIGAG